MTSQSKPAKFAIKSLMAELAEIKTLASLVVAAIALTVGTIGMGGNPRGSPALDGKPSPPGKYAGPATASGDPKGAPGPEGVAGDAGGATVESVQKDIDAAAKGKSGMCPMGTHWDAATYGCSMAETVLQYSGAVVQGGDMVGKALVNAEGQKSQQKMQLDSLNGNYSQGNALKAGADSQDSAANIQNMQGMGALAVAAIEAGLAMKHMAVAKKAITETTDGSGYKMTSANGVPMVQANSATNLSAKIMKAPTGIAALAPTVNSQGQTVSAEHKAIAAKAGSQAIMHGMVGAANMVAAAMAKKGAAELRAASEKIKDIDNNGVLDPLVPFPQPGSNDPGGPISIGPGLPNFPGFQQGGTTLPGQAPGFGSDPLVETPNVAEAPLGGETPTLGGPVAAGVPNTPDAPGKEAGPKSADSGGGGGGGGYSAGGAGSGGENRASNEDPQAQQASNIAQGSLGSTGRGGGGRSNGGGDGFGSDLSKMFADMMGKQKDDDKEQKSILDLSRAPASLAGEDSLLDKNANIFERISSTYAEKQRRGFVGI